MPMETVVLRATMDVKHQFLMVNLELAEVRDHQVVAAQISANKSIESASQRPVAAQFFGLALWDKDFGNRQSH